MCSCLSVSDEKTEREGEGETEREIVKKGCDDSPAERGSDGMVRGGEEESAAASLMHSVFQLSGLGRGPSNRILATVMTARHCSAPMAEQRVGFWPANEEQGGGSVRENGRVLTAGWARGLWPLTHTHTHTHTQHWLSAHTHTVTSGC